MRRARTSIFVAAIAAIGMALGLLAGPAEGQPQPSPTSLASVPATTMQVIEVRAANWHTSHARLRAWARQPDGTWVLVTSARARIGARGLRPAAQRRQGTMTTPAGTFALGQAFGRAPAPLGTKLAYRVLSAADYWVYDPRDPATYNRWVVGRSAANWRTSWAEHLITYVRQYRYAVVIDYNNAVTPGQPLTGAGGGIFLHVNGAGATAGCVSVSRRQMVKLLQWLDPLADPRIVITASPQGA